ncbi:hypothetical protein TGAM01_v210566 [Trichoderma gamsii]|uniref:Short-chain dehydrogenase n=1 Tax=Trichoderma gamsii TaxID=398673 RepID=A0A2P4Z8J4_9HYPO|nr:hypothetical protein TGAM01_v210566 [Trichoderma gamsii]PON20608.1 hypothetical protein TGAM01_v210566 [Trichoderma gamsii]
MPSYVVTGASRGLGYALVKVLASNPLNTVIGLVRDATATRARLDADGVLNVHVVVADICDDTALRKAAEETKRLLGGAGLDVLINNAAEHDAQTVLEDAQKSFDINVSGVLKTVYAFLPLLREGNLKKIVGVSSGMGDIDLINGINLANAAPYAISKAALTTMFAKFNAAYHDEGLLFFTICPGLIDTAEGNEGNTTLSNDDLSRLQTINAKFEEYAPGFKAADPIAAAESFLAAVARSSLEKGV